MTTFTWNVLSMDMKNGIEDGHDDLVTKVYWQCVANDGNFTARLERNTVIPYNPAHHYVDYADMTEAEALEWVFEQTLPKAKPTDADVSVKSATETELQSMIDAQANPHVIVQPLPWA